MPMTEPSRTNKIYSNGKTAPQMTAVSPKPPRCNAKWRSCAGVVLPDWRQKHRSPPCPAPRAFNHIDVARCRLPPRAVAHTTARFVGIWLRMVDTLFEDGPDKGDQKYHNRSKRTTQRGTIILWLIDWYRKRWAKSQAPVTQGSEMWRKVLIPLNVWRFRNVQDANKICMSSNFWSLWMLRNVQQILNEC